MLIRLLQHFRIYMIQLLGSQGLTNLHEECSNYCEHWATAFWRRAAFKTMPYRLAKIDIELSHDNSKDVAGCAGAEALLVQIAERLTQSAHHECQAWSLHASWHACMHFYAFFRYSLLFLKQPLPVGEATALMFSYVTLLHVCF